MKFRNQTLRKAVLERDNFMCQKCKLKDETGKLLEVHHINPIYNRGNEELINLITLCKDCHHFAPNSEKEFNKYIQDIRPRKWKDI